jgi:hypothetical protein
MPSSIELTGLSQLSPSSYCPVCGSTQLDRSSVPSEIVDNFGSSLWTLTEACTMCSWTSSRANVKMGA